MQRRGPANLADVAPFAIQVMPPRNSRQRRGSCATPQTAAFATVGSQMERSGVIERSMVEESDSSDGETPNFRVRLPIS